MINHWKTLTFTVLLTSASFVITPVYAGAMPDSRNEASSILDQALQDIEQNTVPVTEAPEPLIVQDVPVEEPIFEPEPQVTETVMVEPVPQERIVDVQDNQSFFGLSIGAYDALTHDDLAAALGIEWQPGVKIAGFLQPLFGAMVTNEGSFLGYGGVGVPLNVTKNWMIMPSVSAGYYEEGDGYDLGRKLAYRVGAEFAYVFKNKSRLGLNVHAITNGTSLGSDDRTEVISLVYTMPFGKFPQLAQNTTSNVSNTNQ